MQNTFHDANTRETLSLSCGSKFLGLKRVKVDAEHYYLGKLREVQEKWAILKEK